jgi:hypothetical protein
MQNQQGQKKMSYLQARNTESKIDGSFAGAEQASVKRNGLSADAEC